MSNKPTDAQIERLYRNSNESTVTFAAFKRIVRLTLAAFHAPDAPAPTASANELEFDGYKGEECVRWYINELHRIKFLNQWLADAYCNKLREIYFAQEKARGTEDAFASSEADNRIADIWRSCRDRFEGYLRAGFRESDDVSFQVRHDAVSERLLSAITAPPAPAVEPQHVRDSAELRRLCSERDKFKAEARRLAAFLQNKRAIFQAGRDSYETASAPMNTDDEAWDKFIGAHKEGGAE